MKNTKNVITNLIAILVGILTFIFLSQPYFNYVIESIIGNGSTEGISGYEIMGNYLQSEDAKAVVLAISCIMIAVLAGMLILFAIFNLLTGTGVVKVKNPRVMNIVNVFISILMVLVGVVGLCCAGGICKDTSFNGTIGGIQLANGTNKLSWAIIVNFILSFVALGSTMIASIKSGKKSKKKKK